MFADEADQGVSLADAHRFGSRPSNSTRPLCRLPEPWSAHKSDADLMIAGQLHVPAWWTG